MTKSAPGDQANTELATAAATPPRTQPKPFVFVLMPFEAKYDDIYKLGIKSACEEAGTYCERLDEQIFSERMLDRIYNQISKADVIVADVSDRNPNVFYEIGYAHALGKIVVLVTKRTEDIPFDLQHHFHIVYGDSISKLKQELRPRVSYYSSHPVATDEQSAEAIAFFFQGAPLRTNPDQPYPLALKHDFQSRFGKRIISVEIAAHNPADRIIEDLYFTPVLITPKIFGRAITEEGGSSFHFAAISLPDNLVLHRPINSFHLQPGAWDNVVFDLRPPDPGYLDCTGEHLFTLRILSDGPPRNIEFPVFVST
jgi:hypothetical protein